MYLSDCQVFKHIPPVSGMSQCRISLTWIPCLSHTIVEGASSFIRACSLLPAEIQAVGTGLRHHTTQERGQGHRKPWGLLLIDDSESLIKNQQNRTEPRGPLSTEWLPGGRRGGCKHRRVGIIHREPVQKKRWPETHTSRMYEQKASMQRLRVGSFYVKEASLSSGDGESASCHVPCKQSFRDQSDLVGFRQ